MRGRLYFDANNNSVNRGSDTMKENGVISMWKKGEKESVPLVDTLGIEGKRTEIKEIEV